MADFERLKRIGLLFRSVNFNFRQEVDRTLRDSGVELSLAEILPLQTLVAHPGCNGAQLARHNMVSAQAMNAVLRHLAAQRYIERRPHPDNQRADSWFLTGKGARLLERSKAAFEAVTSRMLSGLSAREVDSLETYLRSCAASLEAGAAGSERSAARRRRA